MRLPPAMGSGAVPGPAQQCDVQGGEVADVHHDPGGAAPGHTAHLERCLHALGRLTELITRR